MNLSDHIGALTTLSDEDLRLLNEAIVAELRHRARVRSTQMSATLNVGDRVRFTDNVRPSRYCGLTATVTGKRKTKVEVRVEDTNEVLVVPASLLVSAS